MLRKREMPPMEHGSNSFARRRAIPRTFVRLFSVWLLSAMGVIDKQVVAATSFQPSPRSSDPSAASTPILTFLCAEPRESMVSEHGQWRKMRPRLTQPISPDHHQTTNPLVRSPTQTSSKGFVHWGRKLPNRGLFRRGHLRIRQALCVDLRGRTSAPGYE